MRFKLEGILIVDIARDSAIRIPCSRFKHHSSILICHQHMQPYTPGREAGGKFVPGQIFNGYTQVEHLAFQFRRQVDGRRLGGKLLFGELDGLLELLIQGSHLKRIAVRLQQGEHELVAANKCVLAEGRSFFGIDRGNGDRFSGIRHVAVLAGLFVNEIAVLPLGIGRLLREQFCADFAIIGDVGREQVVAGGAQGRLRGVACLRRDKPRSRLHDRHPVFGYGKLAEQSPVTGSRGFIESQPAAETIGRSQPLGLNLMAQRAGNAVHRQRMIGMRGSKNAVIQHRGLAAGGGGGKMRHRHVAGGAFILDKFFVLRIGQGLPPHGCAVVRITGRIGHHGRAPVSIDGYIHPAGGLQPGVAGRTLPGGGEQCSFHVEQRARLRGLIGRRGLRRRRRAACRHDHQRQNNQPSTPLSVHESLPDCFPG